MFDAVFNGVDLIAWATIVSGTWLAIKTLDRIDAPDATATAPDTDEPE